MLGFTKYSVDNYGSGGGWHRDSANRRQLKFIIYLGDVDENNGCFQYLKGSHSISKKLLLAKDNFFFSSKTRFDDNEINNFINRGTFQKVDFTGRKGTIIVVDTSGLHRGKPLTEGNRLALTYYMSDTKLPKKFSKYLQGPDKQATMIRF